MIKTRYDCRYEYADGVTHNDIDDINGAGHATIARYSCLVTRFEWHGDAHSAANGSHGPEHRSIYYTSFDGKVCAARVNGCAARV